MAHRRQPRRRWRSPPALPRRPCRATDRRISAPLRPAAGLSSSFSPNVSSPTQLTPASATGNAGARRLRRFPTRLDRRTVHPAHSGYPQARAVPTTGTPTLAQASSPAASSTNPPAALDVDKILASRGTSLTTPTSGVSTASATDKGDASLTKAAPAAFSSPGSTVHIVEPGANSATTSQASNAGAPAAVQTHPAAARLPACSTPADRPRRSCRPAPLRQARWGSRLATRRQQVHRPPAQLQRIHVCRR